jgi:hypothetical protein
MLTVVEVSFDIFMKASRTIQGLAVHESYRSTNAIDAL